ncbi:DUF6887 family protein [Nostoc sp.]|uniref:DUF6887 family protein n=1 Tax=Nostoc sp. TaxID=1180 RepID=UPI003FA60E45
MTCCVFVKNFNKFHNINPCYELTAYVLAQRDNNEAIRVLFSRCNPPDSEATWYPPNGD